MSVFQRPQFWVKAFAAVASLVVLQQIWHWEFERIEVPDGKFLIRIHRWGTDLPENDIVAPDETYKGVMLDVWSEGRHFLNPLLWSYEIQDTVVVPQGECLVLSRKFGKELSPERLEQGDILAHEDPKAPMDGERGIVPGYFGPGAYRLNHYAYQWEKVKAVEIQVHQVGVRTRKVGLDPRKLAADAERGKYLVPDGYRGVQQRTLPPGTYYVNPYEETIAPVEVRSHRVELRDIEFPSRDGFILKPLVVVEYAVLPERAPELLVRLTDEGALHQDDATPEQQMQNEVLQKVILPHIRGASRLEGSNFDARDFVLLSPDAAKPMVTNAREALQKGLLEKVKPRCQELGVEVRAVTLADMRPPEELSEQISQRELARVEQAKNSALLKQYKGQQELIAKQTLKKQAAEKVQAETRLLQAQTRSDQLKEVALSRLKQELLDAQLKLDAARNQAEATLLEGKADALVINLQNEAEVAGLSTAVRGFSSVQNFAQYHLLSKLGPALSEIFASDDSELAKLFSAYLSPPNTSAAPPTVLPASTPPGKVTEAAQPRNDSPAPEQPESRTDKPN